MNNIHAAYCHGFAAGYNEGKRDGYREAVRNMDGYKKYHWVPDTTHGRVSDPYPTETSSKWRVTE